MKTIKLSPETLAKRRRHKELLLQQGEQMKIAINNDWKPETEKPAPYKAVLLALIGGGDFTAGHWADRADCWIGYAYNQSPPTYRLDDWTVDPLGRNKSAKG